MNPQAAPSHADPPASPAGGGADRLHRLLSGLLWPALIVLGLAVTAGGLIQYSAAFNDGVFKANAQRLVGAQMRHTRQQLGQRVSDYAWWDEAYAKLHDEQVRDTTWAEKNLGEYMFTSFAVGASLVVDGTDTVRWARSRDGALDGDFRVQDNAGLMTLIRQARAVPTPDPKYVNGIVLLNGAAYTVAASRLSPFENPPETPDTTTSSVLVLLRPLTDIVTDLGTMFEGSFSDMRIEDGPVDGGVALKAVDGAPAGTIAWNADLPSRQVWDVVGLPFAGAMLALWIVIAVLWTKTQRANHELSLRNAALDAHNREIRALMVDLEAEKTRAQAGERAKAQFLAMMSHEIRTPLNGVMGMAQVLLLSRLDDDQRRQAQTILASGQSLLDILNDILDLSKFDAGHMHLDVRDLSVADLLEESTCPFEETARTKGIALSISVDDGVPTRLKGDAMRLRQVLVNLLSNAMKFSKGGRVTLSLTRLRFPDQSGDWYRFSVEDQGIGMTEEVRAKLFQDFVQGDGGITRRFGGTGLGLAICKRLVTLMDGEIGVESEPGRGSRFWFDVPLAPGVPSNVADAALPGPASSSA
ncbi:MAG TPA: ATP-binding protein [Azospirillum sp.]|nr:ATP-binding protein [Azospirillum sp.]